MKYQLLTGDNRQVLPTIADNSIDAIITDPPYGIDFLGKAWDANTGALETYQECLRVLKPGGYLLAFSAARTYHHLAVTLEQAGFEIRDQIMWIYSSGFPKSQDIGRSLQRSLGVQQKKKLTTNGPANGIARRTYGQSKPLKYDETKNAEQVVVTDPRAQAYEGWGTSLKPAHEPICMARKPTKLSIAQNMQRWGTGGLNIDATRIPYNGPTDKPVPHGGKARQHADTPGWMSTTGHKIIENPEINKIGRFPCNVIGEIEKPYQKYFYCPKVSRAERHAGFNLDQVPTIEHNDPETIHLHPLWTPAIGKNVYRLKQAIEEHNAKTVKTHVEMIEEMGGTLVDHEGNPCTNGNKAVIPGYGDIYTHGLAAIYADWCSKNNKTAPAQGNTHPTVKPVALMDYLIKLVTPTGGTVLDPFAGSGSTGMAAVKSGYQFVGIEQDARYVAIAQQRIESYTQPNNLFDQLFD